MLFCVVVALTWVAWRLGEWQFHRLAERQERNAIVERNEREAPVDVRQVMTVGAPVAEEDQWRLVRASGEYAVDDTVVVRYRTREGESGVDVVVPLVLDDGTSLLVDRGWWATDNRGTTPDDVPDPPPGTVAVTGWVRQDAEGDSTAVSDHSTRAVSSTAIGSALERPVLAGFVDLQTETPPAATPLEPVELPDLGNGPHFFYGLQWWFFGLLAVVGFCYLVLDEWRGPRPPREQRRQIARSMPPSTGTIAPDTNDAAGESKKAATRPNSSGAP